ncbi:hypothetical protein PBRA_000330 [Plasmodiophora brassicae]|nr:hypothetical protein PBRA_000330 [Plasmodiophora brassicae]
MGARDDGDELALWDALQAGALLSTGRFTHAGRCASLQWTYKHRASNSTVAISSTHSVDGARQQTTAPADFEVTAPVSLSSYCHRGCCRAVIRKPSDDTGAFLEIYRQGRPPLTTSLKKVCGELPKGGSCLSGASFSANCDKFAFSADVKPDDRQSFWNDTPAHGNDAGSQPSRGTQYDYKQDWGEGLGLLRTIVVLVDIVDDRLLATVLDKAFNEKFSWGQVVFHPRQPYLLAVGYPQTGRRLGLLHFNTRRSSMFVASLERRDECATCITPADHSATLPRFNHDGSVLVYVTTDDVGFHISCSRLRSLSWADGPVPQSTRTIVDVVRANNTFPGLWPRGFPTRCWLADTSNIVVASQCQIRFALLVIDTRNGSVQELDIPGPFSSADVLDVHGFDILVKLETVGRPPEAFIGRMDPSNVQKVLWTAVSSPPLPFPSPVNHLSIPHCVIDVDGLFDAILVGTIKEDTRLIAFPHGGPHSAFTTTFATSVAFLALQGFALLEINYRGSTGYGQDMLESLPGRCGTQDVEDCMKAVDAVLSRFPSLSKDNVAVMGGSHGGFLTLWLIAKYPDRFRSAVARNPVANVAHMMSTTDIADWCAIECGLAFSPTGVPSAAHYEAMYKCSPISMIERVNTPLLLMLGANDKRVPMSQAVDYYHLLQARGVETRCIIYPGNGHSLTDRVDTESDHWINVLHWLRKL